MKNLIKVSLRPLVIALSAIVLPFSAEASPSLATEAQRDYAAGRYADAKVKFSQILAQNPSNAVARNYLNLIRTAEAQAQKNQLQAQLATLIVPNVAMREATLDAVLEMLPKVAEEASGGKLKPSFVVDQGVNREKAVTLQLSNVPFTEVLRYVGLQAGTSFRIEQYAIRVSSKSATEAGEATAAPTTEATGG